MFHIASFHEAAHPSGAAGGGAGAAAGRGTAVGSPELVPVPGPAPSIAGFPEILGRPRCDTDGEAGFAPEARSAVVEKEDGGAGDLDARSAVLEAEAAGIPRSRSPIFGKSFIVSPQY